MSARFSEVATALSGVAARQLGWRPDEFWRATPAELFAALDEPISDAAPLDRDTLQRLMENENG